jgi:acetyl-CoA C-acetyltransferase
MGITAENIADTFGITRAEQDAFAYASQRKAIEAVDGGEFRDEIVPLTVKGGEFSDDEYPNRTTTPEKLAGLRPAFKKDGTVTAGNSSGINDGASFVMLASGEKARELGLEPLAQIVAVGQGGVEPGVMGLGPVPAIAQALERANLKLLDIDLLELNEAFAAQALGVMRRLSEEHNVSAEWLSERTNVSGGAIALGHPIGASGNRILVTLVHALRRRGGRYGLASLCIGGGMGTAVIVEVER